MRAISVFISILLMLVWGGCASIPLTQSEKKEYQKAMENCSDSMDFYKDLLNPDRTPISAKVVNNQSSDILESEVIKSRKLFSGWTRLKRGLLNRDIEREELDIRTNLY